MSDGGLRLSDAGQQLKLLDDSVNDDRPVIPTGFAGIDQLLRRGGLLPGNLVVLGGRTGTRKTTLMTNLMVNMAEAGTPVALVGLDEPPWQYVVQLLSTWADLPQEHIENIWNTKAGKKLRREWKDFARDTVHLFGGRRPSPDDLTEALDMASIGMSDTPGVVFLDYLAQMSRRDQYGYGDMNRLPLLVEDLGIWSTETGVVVVILHQLSRTDEYGNTNHKNAGHIPVTLTQLKYAGEEAPDIVFGTYRPEMNPLAQMELRVAKEVYGDRFDEDIYNEVKGIARKYKHSTLLQVLKNRPGTKRDERGVELLSLSESLRMVEADREERHG